MAHLRADLALKRRLRVDVKANRDEQQRSHPIANAPAADPRCWNSSQRTTREKGARLVVAHIWGGAARILLLAERI